MVFRGGGKHGGDSTLGTKASGVGGKFPHRARPATQCGPSTNSTSAAGGPNAVLGSTAISQVHYLVDTREAFSFFLIYELHKK